MAARKKGKQRPSNASSTAPTQENTAAKEAPKTTSRSLSQHRIPALILALFGFALYMNTIPFQFALDDKLYITHNEFTMEGVDGIGDLWGNELLTGFYGKRKQLVAGGRYRPLPLTMHAIEWELFGPDKNDRAAEKQDALDTLASYSHFINALLYGLTGLLLFSILSYLFPPEHRKWYLTFSFIATALFLAHPLHTEVVANIKSRDELMSVAGALLALRLFLSYLDNNNFKSLAFSGLALLSALFSKESSITFLGIIPLTVYFFTNHSLKKNFMGLLPLLGLSVLYILIRYSVLGSAQAGEITELMNNPFVDASPADKFATVIYTMGLYIKLLFFPHPLTHDYYPYHIPIVDWSHPGPLISLATYVALIGIAAFGIVRKTMYSYGILLFLGSFILFSNLVFPIGTFMNERFMYIPSIGFSMVIAYLIAVKLPRILKNPNLAQIVPLALTAVLIMGFSIKTVTRNYAWENDYSLAMTDVKTSKNSAKARMAAGDALLNKYQDIKDLPDTDPAEVELVLHEATEHLSKSKDIYPTYKAAWHLLGNAFFYRNNLRNSMICYQNCLKRDQNFQDGISNLMIVAGKSLEEEQTDVAIECYQFLLDNQGPSAEVYEGLGEVHGKYLKDLGKSEEYMLKAYELDPKNSGVLQKLGVIYAMQQRNDKAMEFLQKSLKEDPNSAPVWLNIGILYRNTGQIEEAEKHLQKAYELDPKMRPQ